jgi:hypothetical protein
VDPSIRLVRDAGGALSADDVAERWRARRGAPLRATVERLLIERGRILFVDHAAEPDQRFVLQDLALDAHDVATVADGDTGRASATFMVGGAPGKLTLTDIGVRPLRARAVLQLDGLDVAPFGAYTGAHAPLRPVAGRLSTRITLEYDARGFMRTSGAGTLRDLAVARAAQAAVFLSAPAIEFSARDVSYVGGRPAVGHMALSVPRATVFDATAPRARPLDVTGLRFVFEGANNPAAAPGRVALSADLPGGGRLKARGTGDLFAPEADLTVEVSGVHVALAQVWTPVGAALVPAAGETGGALRLRYAGGGPLTVAGRAWIADLEIARRGQRLAFVHDDYVEIAVRDLGFAAGGATLGRVDVVASPTVTDETSGSARRFHLPRVSLTATGGGFPAGGTTDVALLASLPRGGRLEAKGTARLGVPAAAALDVAIRDVDVTLARAYLPARAPVAVAGGRLDARIDVRWSGGLEADGRFTARDLAVLRRGQSEPFVAHAAIEGTFAGLAVGGGRLALARLTLAGAPTIVDATARPPQRFETRRLTLTVTDLAWPGPQPARVEGRAEIADGGRAALSGTIHPATLAADVRVVFDDVDVSRARGYLPAGLPILVEEGRAGATVTLRHTRGAGVRLDATGTARDLSLQLTAGPAVRVRDDRVSFTVDGLAVKDGVVTVGAAVIESTPRLVHGSESTAVVPRVRAELTGLAWPGQDAADLALTAVFPEAGRLEARGTFVPATRTVDVTIRAEDAPLEPLALLFPVDAPVAGRLDARLVAALRADAATALTVRGDLTLRDGRIGPADTAPVRIDRAHVDGLRASEDGLEVARLALLRPSVLIEREGDGTFPLRAMFMPGASGYAAPRERGTERRAGSDDAAAFAFHVDEVVVEDGDVRFVDGTTTPFYSEELTRLTMTIDDLTNVDDRRATLAIQGIVGVDGALDLHGEMAPFASPFFLEVEGELRDFAVPRTNPYLRRFLDWIARRGQLTTQVHYRIVGDDLSAVNELLVQRLDLEPARGDDRAERLVGLPLGLVVSLLKDARGDIRFTLPVSGELGSPEFSFGDAITQALRTVLGRLVTAPLRAIGSVFRRDGKVEDVAIDPVTFDPGSAVLRPDAAAHLQRVADFLRASPYVRLTVEPRVTERDLQALRAQEVTARIQRVQRDQEIDDFARAARRVWRRSVPGVAPPEDPRAIVRMLAEREPVPSEAARRLAERRQSVTRTYLVGAAGIQPDRLLDPAGSPPSGAAGDGRVEFSLEPAS